MNRATSASAAIALLSLSAALGFAEDGGPFLDGRWEGSVDFGAAVVDGSASGLGRPEALVLRLFPADPETGAATGGLVDMPSRGLYGFPMGDMTRNPEGLSFSLRDGAPVDGLFELRLSPQPAGAGGSFAVGGAARLWSADGEGGRMVLAEGSFFLALTAGSSRGPELGADFRIDTGRGLLPGSFLMPEAADGGPLPVVLLLSGAQADRDGNNYSVPGRSDALAELAMALRERGVASLRFDKRGTGEAYALAGRNGELRFDDHIEDARAALRLLAADPRFSSVTVVGFAEGALVGACALEESASGDAAAAAEKGRIAGLAALCASGRTEVETVEDALSATPEELKGEASAIMEALKSGDGYPNPSPYFADFFRPGDQGYLSSLFWRDIRAAFAAAGCPVLVIAGGSDLQVALDEARLLADANGGAAYRVIPGMSHALKGVGDDEEANYASFTNPGMALAEGLPDLVAAFAKRSAMPSQPLPGTDPRLKTAAGAKGGDDAAEGVAR
jgi:hypothetical protein